MNYTSTDLAEIRDRLRQRREDLRNRTQRIEADLRREADPLSPDAPDRAVQRGNDDVLQAIESAALAELEQLDRALHRLDTGQYQECEACHGPIESERLAVLPYATRCRDCASGA